MDGRGIEPSSMETSSMEPTNMDLTSVASNDFDTVTMEQAQRYRMYQIQARDALMKVFMNLKAFKKRRGRPPKYLNIWRQEYLMKMATENNLNPDIVSKIQGILGDEKQPKQCSVKVKRKPEAQYYVDMSKEENEEGESSQKDDQDPTRMVLSDSRPRSDEMIRNRPDEDNPKRPKSAEVIKAEMLYPETDSPIQTEPDRESLLGISRTRLASTLTPTYSIRHQQEFQQNYRKYVKPANLAPMTFERETSEINNNKDGRINNSMTPMMISEDSSEDGAPPSPIGQNFSSISLSQQLQTEQTTKRRPGRPPGSTKKFKAQLTIDEDKKDNSPETFSLRKFFEAGGRDYNEYLEWLKRKHTTDTSPTTCTPPSPYVPVSMPSNGTLPPLSSSQSCNLFSARSPAAFASSVDPSRLPPPPHRSPAVPGDVLHIRPFSGFHSPIILRLSPCPEMAVSSGPAETEPAALDLSSKKRPIEETEPENSPTDLSAGAVDFTARSEGETSRTSTPKLSSGSYAESVSSPGAERDLQSWDVEQVARFVAEVPGCQDYVQAFRDQMIDGATLPHLSEEHLLKFVSMKLGPAIRLKLAVAAHMKDPCR